MKSGLAKSLLATKCAFTLKHCRLSRDDHRDGLANVPGRVQLVEAENLTNRGVEAALRHEAERLLRMSGDELVQVVDVRGVINDFVVADVAVAFARQIQLKDRRRLARAKRIFQAQTTILVS